MGERTTSIYTRQLGSGVAKLAFDEPLEQDFRAQYATRNIAFLRVGAAQGLVFVSLSALLDWRLGPATDATPVLVKLGLIAPAFVLLLAALHASPLMRHIRRAATLAAVALIVGCTALLFAATSAALTSTIVVVHVATLYVYLMLGLRLYPALILSLPLTVVLMWVETRAGAAGSTAAIDCVFLLFTNVVGALTCYRLEHAARTSFLEREIVNVLSGNDSMTGIPNRRAFNRHLQTIHRQAERDGRRIALLLAEVDAFDDFKARYGGRLADSALRRIAHAVLRTLKRPLDFGARFGEFEFAVLLYDPDPNHLQAIMREIRERVTLLDIEHEGANRTGLVSISVGAALSAGVRSHDPEKLLIVADQALAEAKAPQSQGIAVRSTGPREAAASVTAGPWVSIAPE